MGKKILRSVFFIAGLALLIAAVSVIIKPRSEMYDVIGVERKLEEFGEEKDNSIDLIFLGDSETYSAYNPIQMYGEYGFTSYVCGTSAQRLCDSYALLQEVFKNQSPKIVVLETNNIFRYGGLADDSNDKMLGIVSKRIPAVRYHTRVKMYMTDSGSRGAKDRKGFIYRTACVPYLGGEWMKPSDDSEEIMQCNLEYLEKLKKLTDDNGAKLIFVSTPSPLLHTYERHNAVKELAAKFGTDYIDLNLLHGEIGIDWNTDTKDAGNHLNYEGAVKVSSYIGNIMASVYGLPDHKNDGEYM